MPDLNLDEIKRRWSRVTPGEWRVREMHNINDHNPYFVAAPRSDKSPFGQEILSDEDYPTKREDCEAVAHARTDVLALIAEVERLRKGREGHDSDCRIYAAVLMHKYGEGICNCGYGAQVHRAENSMRAMFSKDYAEKFHKATERIKDNALEEAAKIFDSPETIETMSAHAHDAYQAEAHRRGDVRHADKYDDLSEPTKEWDRVLCRWAAREIRALKSKTEKRG